MSLKKSVNPFVAVALGLSLAASPVAFAKQQVNVKKDRLDLHKRAMQVLSNGNGYHSSNVHSLGRHGLIRWSGDAGVDVGYADRGERANLIDFSNTGSSRTDVHLNHVVLSADAKVSDWVSFRSTLVLVEPKTLNHITVNGRNYNNDVTLNEAYIHIGNGYKSPVYLQVGREWTDFGYFKEAHPITPSLVQSLTQANQATIKLGLVDDSGVMASLSAFNDTPSNKAGRSRISNFIAKIAYANKYEGINYRLDASYVHYLKDMGIIREHANFYDTGRVGAYALHANASYGDVCGSVDFMSALGNVKGANSHVSAGGVSVSYKFKTADWASYLKAGYQISTQGKFITQGTDSLPKSRYEVGYGVDVTQNAQMQLTYDHERSYKQSNSEKSANAVKLRFSVQF